eukprot:3067917-Pyramimonas_sp.AAC.1
MADSRAGLRATAWGQCFRPCVRRQYAMRCAWFGALSGMSGPQTGHGQRSCLRKPLAAHCHATGTQWARNE